MLLVDTFLEVVTLLSAPSLVLLPTSFSVLRLSHPTVASSLLMRSKTLTSSGPSVVVVPLHGVSSSP